MKKYPHVPSAFINSIREEDTHEKACDYLQEQWNECCALKQELKIARREERERCAKWLEDAWGQKTMADKLRALEDEK